MNIDDDKKCLVLGKDAKILPSQKITLSEDLVSFDEVSNSEDVLTPIKEVKEMEMDSVSS